MADKKGTPGGGGGGGSCEEEEMVAGQFSQKSGFDLVQNCDLPPPMKIFGGQDKMIASSMNNVYNMIARQRDEGEGVEMANEKSCENETLELFKALRLSQTRAREAERKAAVLSKERDDLSNLLLQQSTYLFAYKQWVRMMEFQLHTHREKQESGYGESSPAEKEPKEEDENRGGKGTTWLVAVAICVGIAGMGLLSFFS